MEFPNGRHHQHHHHHQRDDEERQNYPPPGATLSSFDQSPPPPPSYYGADQSPPPPSYYGEDQPLPPPPSYYGEDQSPSFYREDQPPPYSISHYGADRPPPNAISHYGADRPPPTQVSHVSHSFHGHAPPISQSYLHQPPPPPPAAVHNSNYPSEPTPPVTVHHVTHQVHQQHDQQSPAQFESHHTSHLPSFHLHHSDSASSYFSNKPTFRVFAKAEPNFYLTIREGTVILARSHSTDDFQHWYKDEKYSTLVKDEERFPSFALVNKATGQALKHSTGATHPVQLIAYNPDVLDESVLWTESADLGDGFRTVRMVNNIHLNLDAFHGDKKSGGVHDGTTIVTWYKNKGDNQRWKIVPY